MITLASPAKVNLFLKIVGKRADGYHDLVSLFQTISLADTLTIEESTYDLLTCSDSQIPINAENTVAKALLLFRLATKIQTPVRIHIEKRIPTGAGLGGGSSNAATTLFGLNQLFKSPLSLKELHEIGQDVGSDVPFFFSCGSALCKGRGEIIESFPNPVSGDLFIVMPPFALSTKEVYQTLNCAALKKREFKPDMVEFFNDLEEPAFFLAPKLKELKENLSKMGSSAVFMTGSGAALVLLGSKAPSPIEQCSIFPAHFISRNEEAWYATS